MSVNRPPSPHISFLTCFYVLNAGLAHKQVTWAWEKVNRRTEIEGWYTLYQDIAGQSFIVDSVMSLWLFFSFLAALFPHFRILRCGTLFGFFGAMVLRGKADESLFAFLIEISPLFFFAFIPNSLLFSSQTLNKIIRSLKRDVNLIKTKMKMYHFLLLIPLFMIICHSFQKYLFYKQSFFLLISLFIVMIQARTPSRKGVI